MEWVECKYIKNILFIYSHTIHSIRLFHRDFNKQVFFFSLVLGRGGGGVGAGGGYFFLTYLMQNGILR